MYLLPHSDHLRPLQHCTKWVPAGLSLDITQPVKAGQFPPSNAMVNNAWSFGSTYWIHLYGAQFRHNDNFTVCLKNQAVKIYKVF